VFGIRCSVLGATPNTEHRIPNTEHLSSPDTIELPGPGSHDPGERSLTETMAETEKQMLIQALEDSNWNLTRAAETLGITFRSMRYNVKKYGLSREEEDRQPAGARR
jgi:transcriptional regulator with GAF, ATPase, and Fis domain